MASLRAIRSRIKSVKGTQKITKAMKMVAAAKLRRAQDNVVRARPYAELVEQMLARLATGEGENATHPLLARRPMRRVEVVVLTSDRGLAGGFNANVIRRLQRFLVDHAGKVERLGVSTIGRRGREFASKRGVTVRKDYAGYLGKLDYSKAKAIADDLIKLYQGEDLDAVFLLYNRFQSALVQKVTLTQLLPIQPAALAETMAPAGYAPAEFVFEPSREAVLESLLPKHLGMQVWRALLESEASEHGARMTAMDNATKNAKEMIAKLTLEYNRARQAAITKELMEIVSGAEAIK
jgi:F-type H+-transporting ATPase subunit gamma